MKKLLLMIFATVIFLPKLSFAEDEVIWETDVIGGLNEVEVSPLGEVLYNTNDSIIEVRNITDGKLIDKIIFTNTTRLDQISISADGRFMAVSGETKFVIIYDLFEKREVKRITTIVYEREEFGKDVIYDTEKWTSSSISPDGKKITGVAFNSSGYFKTNFVVIDIETEKVLFEQRRITYEADIQETEAFKWMSAEFSPDGNYIVAQLDYNAINDVRGPDSVYIYNANTLKLYDVVLNDYSEYTSPISFSNFESKISFISIYDLLVYNFINKTLEKFPISKSPFSILFSRKSNDIIYGFGFENHILNLDTKEIIYTYKKVTVPKEISLDNSKLFSVLNNRLYCLNTYFTTTFVENGKGKNIIFPNPTTGKISLNLSNLFSSTFKYNIISDSGQVILSKELGFLQPNANNLNIDISTIASGHYILRIFSDREEFTFSIIKEN